MAETAVVEVEGGRPWCQTRVSWWRSAWMRPLTSKAPPEKMLNDSPPVQRYQEVAETILQETATSAVVKGGFRCSTNLKKSPVTN